MIQVIIICDDLRIIVSLIYLIPSRLRFHQGQTRIRNPNRSSVVESSVVKSSVIESSVVETSVLRVR